MIWNQNIYIQNIWYKIKEILYSTHDMKNISFRGTIINRKRNWEYYYTDTRVSPIKNPKGEIYKFVIVRYDITKVKEYEKELEKLTYIDHF